jgi:uncharacterized protein
MKRLLLAVAFACSAMTFGYVPSAYAAPPTDAQIDRLMDTMDMRRTVDEMMAQMEGMSETMGLQILGENASAEERESLKRISAQQQQAMRKSMTWETLAPIYRRIYAKLFTAEEVDAMIGFYGSDTGKGIMRKMPQAMQLSMEEMQPIMIQMIGEMQKTLETELKKDDQGK